MVTHCRLGMNFVQTRKQSDAWVEVAHEAIVELS